jgi:hypothetical protein
MHEFNYSKDTIDRSGNLQRGTERKLFIHAKGDLYGLQFDLGYKPSFDSLLVDSLLNAEAFKSYNWNYDPAESPDTTIADKKNNSAVDVYVSKKPKDPSVSDSVYYYYSGKLNGLNHSLSPYLDSLKGMKFHKFVAIHNEVFIESHNITLPKRAFVIELKSIPVRDVDEKMYYFQRFKELRGH